MFVKFFRRVRERCVKTRSSVRKKSLSVCRGVDGACKGFVKSAGPERHVEGACKGCSGVEG